MVDGFSLVCPVCGQGRDLSLGLAPNENGQLICANCGAEIPIPVAAPDESLGDTATSPTDLPTVVDPQHKADPAGDGSVESMLGDCGSGRYSEQQTIGKGGMGEIVLCVEQNVRREVAMKRLLPTAAKHARQRARFVQEAQVTGQLEHPNIVPIHELGRDSRGAIYFTMKLVKGRSLGEILHASRDGEETHSLGELLGIFLKVCDGVAFAHSRGVVHRDLKPANIMVGDFGEVLVMDWGIARILGRDEIPGQGGENIVQSSRHDADTPAMHTLAGSVMGSPQYMPPEQAAGEIDKIDHRSDIYSLGAILYEILTLKRPFEGGDARAIVTKVIEGKIHSPERRAPGREIPRELSAVAMKCLAKYRGKRYASVPDLQRDISLYLEGRSVSAAPDTFAQALVKLIKRNRGISAALAAASVILIVLTAVFVVRLKGERDNAVASELKAVTAQQRQRATALAASKRFAMQAIRAAETGRWDEARRRVTDAETVALSSPWGPYARGMFARTNKDYPVAADLFRKALGTDPDHTESKAALSETLVRVGDLDQAKKLLSGAGDITDWRTMLKVGQTLYDTERWKDCLVVFKRAIELMAKAKDAPKGLRVATEKEVRKKIIRARAKALCIGFAEEIKNLPPKEQIKRVEAKLEEISGKEVKIPDVEIKIENGEWIQAGFPHRTTAFLDPLRGLRLQSLTIANTLATDLEPLKGMPLVYLNCSSTWVVSLKPLEGMPLKDLQCRGTAIIDLSPLRGMPLTSLGCSLSPVSDLGPLKGMGLKELSIHETNVTDLTPLKGMNLEKLRVGVTKIKDLGALKGMQLESLDCGRTPVSDLAPLKGMSLTCLNISETKVTDLGPLKGLKLTNLAIAGTKVTDLTPLKGMPLTSLACSVTPVSDLNLLKGMPLKELFVHETKVTDLRPLEGMKLIKFSFTPKNTTKGIGIIRGMKSMRLIGVAGHVLVDPERFWKKYDAGEFE